ncbi:RHS repeat domain-containing protein [Snodgrassella alvi]|uniref:RHS repeat domain-containing protein n=1 Tax=Snodgrassella alvi TaxID=1196083 RepID=UPI00345F174C
MIQETRTDRSKSVYIYTDESGYEPLARVETTTGTEQKVLYYHTDVNGAPEELTDEDGHIVWACSYQLWGKPIQEIEHSQIQQNLRYLGQYLDRETGLHYNTFRYYDPDIGRFTQPDPIGLLGGFNLYQYAPNGLTWIDPCGWIHLNTNGATGNFGVYEIRIDGELYKYGKADLNRITKSSGQPTRLHQQIEKLRKLHPGKDVRGNVIEKGFPTTKAAKAVETLKIDEHYTKTGKIPVGNQKSYKPKGLCK